jgi:hypothetical protein
MCVARNELAPMERKREEKGECGGLFFGTDFKGSKY